MPRTRRNPGQPETNPKPMSSTKIEVLVAQHVADVITSLQAPMNLGSGGNGGERSQRDNQGPTRIHSYKDFRNCKTKRFYRNEGEVGLTRWMEKMESVFEISLCLEDCKVKFATCTLADATLSWWNSLTKTMGINATNAMSWSELKQLMVGEYCPHKEMKKL